MIKSTLKIKSGGDVPQKLSRMMRLVADNVKKSPIGLASGMAANVMQHCTVDQDRGMLTATFRNLNVDLQTYVSDTHRLPGFNHPINQNEVSKGLRLRVFPQGNRLTVEVHVDDLSRLFADIKNNRNNPLALLLTQMADKVGLKKS